MALDLSTVEGLDAETIEALSKNESFQGVVSAYVEESTNNRVEVAKSEFKTKMNAMDAKVQEFKSVADAFEGC